MLNITQLHADTLLAADEGSYYTIIGAGGDLTEWIDGYTAMLKAEEIGTPSEWFITTGGAINLYASATHGTVTDPFKEDITVLMFPLTGLNASRLAILKLRAQDRWFDDIVDNMTDDANVDGEWFDEDEEI
jgi:hypothetical protein